MSPLDRSGLPIWLLDFDGVINAISSMAPTDDWPKDSWTRTSAKAGERAWPILAAQPVCNFITRAHEQGLADIRWHSTWQEHTVNISTALGLPQFPVEPAPECRDYGRHGWWKPPAVSRLLNAGYRVLWTDDDIDPYLSKDTRLAFRLAGCRMISPAAERGLTQGHLVQIASFLDQARRVRDSLTAPQGGASV